MSAATSSTPATSLARAAPRAPEAAAQVDHHGARPSDRDRLVDQKLRAPARHEDPRLDRDAQAVEFGPAEDDLERFARDPALDHRAERRRVVGRAQEQRGLVLREDAARRPEGEHDLGLGARGEGEVDAVMVAIMLVVRSCLRHDLCQPGDPCQPGGGAREFAQRSPFGHLAGVVSVTAPSYFRCEVRGVDMSDRTNGGGFASDDFDDDEIEWDDESTYDDPDGLSPIEEMVGDTLDAAD